jgi:hypothetical protein
MTDIPSYQQAYDRIRAEYVEMPGMRLTPQQVQRLSGFDNEVCTGVLDGLVLAKFLCVGRDGRYSRLTDGPSVPLRPAKPGRGRSLHRSFHQRHLWAIRLTGSLVG